MNEMSILTPYSRVPNTPTGFKNQAIKNKNKQINKTIKKFLTLITSYRQDVELEQKHPQ